MPRLFIALTIITLLVSLSFYALSPPPSNDASSEGLSVAETLGNSDDIEGYARAREPREFVFPADHGPHPDFRNEWWYVTGNLITDSGQRFGYQITLFRIALSPEEPERDSDWRTRQIFMGHFGFSDISNGQHYSFERFSRAAVGLAGATVEPLRIWLEDWALNGSDGDLFPLNIQVAENGIALDLQLHTARPVVLQGNRGLSQKSAGPGNASYYYSFTRLPTQGRIRLNGKDFDVTGNSWLDREWSTNALGPNQTGWDWFALQLDDGRDLMFYRLRLSNGSTDPYSKGVLVATDGSYQLLSADMVHLTPLTWWQSPLNGDRYPIRWQLDIPEQILQLTVSARLNDQEMKTRVRYWEGAVTVNGQSSGQPITGQGYLEMTQYGNDGNNYPVR